VDNIDTEELLEKVGAGEIDCTVADSNIVAINRRYYPELSVRFNLSRAEPIAWMLPMGSNALEAELNHWFEEFEQDGELRNLMERYYGHIEVFDYVDTRQFVRRIEQVLPRYRPHFEAAASDNDMDWTLLAAQSYQESHWQPGALSPTGVRGMMMLTQTTARDLDISNRMDPAKSIQGGARYLRQLYKRIPDAVQQRDRIWFALAAYNVGMGHLRDAMQLAQSLKKNPHVWSDLSGVFPLLSRKQYYKSLEHGYARGREPVTYVKRIKDYQNILLQKLRRK